MRRDTPWAKQWAIEWRKNFHTKKWWLHREWWMTHFAGPSHNNGIGGFSGAWTVKENGLWGDHELLEFSNPEWLLDSESWRVGGSWEKIKWLELLPGLHKYQKDDWFVCKYCKVEKWTEEMLMIHENCECPFRRTDCKYMHFGCCKWPLWLEKWDHEWICPYWVYW